MKFAFTPCAFLMAIVCPLISCSNSPSSGEAAWNDFTSSFFSGLDSVASLEGEKIPLLNSPEYEAKWGKPKIRVSKAGNYELSYANPAEAFDRFVIYGSARPFPKLSKAPKMSVESVTDDKLRGVTLAQSFRTVKVLGQTVRWFQESTSGGADGAYYSTEGFTLKDGSGKVGHYRMVVEAGDEAGAEVTRRFASARALAGLHHSGD